MKLHPLLASALRAGSQASMLLAVSLLSSSARADPPFVATPSPAFSPTPVGWTYTYGTLTNDMPSGGKRRLIVPLHFESLTSTPGVYWQWQATLEAGGATRSSTISCKMYAVANQVPLNASQPVLFDGSSASMSFTIDRTLGKAVYIDCWVPPYAWIGSVTWSYSSVQGP